MSEEGNKPCSVWWDFHDRLAESYSKEYLEALEKAVNEHMSEEKIKPCPFCSCENTHIMPLVFEGRKGFSIHCLDCGAVGPFRIDTSLSVQFWNDRMEEKCLSSELSRVRQTLCEFFALKNGH